MRDLKASLGRKMQEAPSAHEATEPPLGASLATCEERLQKVLMKVGVLEAADLEDVRLHTESLQEQLNDAKAHANKLQQENEALENQRNKMKELYQSCLVDMQTQLRNFEKEKEGLATIMEKFLTERAQFNTEKDGLFAQVEKERKQFYAELADLGNHLKAKEKEVEDKHRETMEKLEGELEEAEQAYNQLYDDLVIYHGRLELLRTHKEKLIDHKTGLDAVITKLTQEAREKSATIISIGHECEQLKAEKATLGKWLKAAREKANTITSTEQERDKVKVLYQKNLHMLEGLRMTINELEGGLRTAEEEKKKITLNLQAAEDNITILQGRLALMRSWKKKSCLFSNYLRFHAALMIPSIMPSTTKEEGQGKAKSKKKVKRLKA
jgi:chromosome segregation ATPase